MNWSNMLNRSEVWLSIMEPAWQIVMQYFKSKMQKGDSISVYMSQVNHPNKKGHQLTAGELIPYFN